MLITMTTDACSSGGTSNFRPPPHVENSIGPVAPTLAIAFDSYVFSVCIHTPRWCCFFFVDARFNLLHFCNIVYTVDCGCLKVF